MSEIKLVDGQCKNVGRKGFENVPEQEQNLVHKFTQYFI